MLNLLTGRRSMGQVQSRPASFVDVDFVPLRDPPGYPSYNEDLGDPSHPLVQQQFHDSGGVGGTGGGIGGGYVLEDRLMHGANIMDQSGTENEVSSTGIRLPVDQLDSKPLVNPSNPSHDELTTSDEDMTITR